MREFSRFSTRDRPWPLAAAGDKRSTTPTAGNDRFPRGGRNLPPNYRDVQYGHDLSDDIYQIFLDQSLTYGYACFPQTRQYTSAKRTKQGRHSRL